MKILLSGARIIDPVQKIDADMDILLENGKIVKTVDEQYLRSDIPCGHVSCPMCSFNQSKLIITNIYT